MFNKATGLAFCPFCGSSQAQRQHYNAWSYTGVYIECATCGARTRDFEAAQEETCKMLWNNRANLKE